MNIDTLLYWLFGAAASISIAWVWIFAMLYTGNRNIWTYRRVHDETHLFVNLDKSFVTEMAKLLFPIFGFRCTIGDWWMSCGARVRDHRHIPLKSLMVDWKNVSRCRYRDVAFPAVAGYPMMTLDGGEISLGSKGRHERSGPSSQLEWKSWSRGQPVTGLVWLDYENVRGNTGDKWWLKWWYLCNNEKWTYIIKQRFADHGYFMQEDNKVSHRPHTSVYFLSITASEYAWDDRRQSNERSA